MIKLLKRLFGLGKKPVWNVQEFGNIYDWSPKAYDGKTRWGTREIDYKPVFNSMVDSNPPGGW